LVQQSVTQGSCTACSLRLRYTPGYSGKTRLMPSYIIEHKLLLLLMPRY
jgi:hypothetical protein